MGVHVGIGLGANSTDSFVNVLIDDPVILCPRSDSVLRANKAVKDHHVWQVVDPQESLQLYGERTVANLAISTSKEHVQERHISLALVRPAHLYTFCSS